MKALMFSLMILSAIACDVPVDESTETATAGTTSETAVTETVATETASAATQTTSTEMEKPMSEYTDKVAVLKTSKGDITVRFFPDVAPNHVRNFLELSEKGFYDGVRFHRVIPGFMIQGGDPNTKSEAKRSSWGTGGAEKNVKAEFSKVPHRRGILSMARSGHPDSASSQFFIVVKDSNFLDNQYTVFGQVTEGMEVADAIVAEGKGVELPANPVTIQKVTVRPATEKEKGPTPK